MALGAAGLAAEQRLLVSVCHPASRASHRKSPPCAQHPEGTCMGIETLIARVLLLSRPTPTAVIKVAVAAAIADRGIVLVRPRDQGCR